ncbi:MAG: NAD(P)/FAD-dependent oxidoreductase [Bacteroidia bacterium]
MLSFWEKNSFLGYDIVIVGAGINGLSAACAIKEKHPQKSVLILERGSWPLGASTRNAGFACFGSFAEIRDDIIQNGLDKALQLIEWRVKGMEIHKKRLGFSNMGYKATGGGEILFDDEPFELEELAEMNKNLYPILKNEVFKNDISKVTEFGFNPKNISQFITNSCEGQIDSGLLMYNLWQYTASLGVIIMNGMEVLNFNDTGKGCEIVAKHNLLNETPTFKCQTLIFSTNAFSKQFFPNMDVIPGRGQILATKPISGLKFEGIFHFRQGYYYFRNYGNRIIFGGGRNENIELEKTTEIKLNNEIQNSLDQYLKNLIIPNTAYEIDCRWAGIMAFGKDKLPIIERVSPNVIAGVRMGGMGVALSGITAERIADMIN